ncbi:GbsR/MarR family transcriptional regulator [Streptomyces sp. NPDC055078]
MTREDRQAQSQAESHMRFADEVGSLLLSGLPPMAGRMLGTLLLAEEPRLSTKELAARMGASSVTVSSMGRLLLGLNMVERTVSPETRRDEFSLRSASWADVYSENAKGMSRLVTVLDERLADPDLPDVARVRILELRNFHAYLLAYFPEMLSRFHQWRAEHGPHVVFHADGDPAPDARAGATGSVRDSGMPPH